MRGFELVVLEREQDNLSARRIAGVEIVIASDNDAIVQWPKSGAIARDDGRV